MYYDATLKKLFRRPPDRLLAYALGAPVVIRRALPTEQIVIEKVHPDLLLETEDGRILHVELQGYPKGNFACRNLIYYALVLRDYNRPPKQIVFWVGDGKVGVQDGLSHEPDLTYHYHVINVRKMDPAFLLEGSDPSEWVFAVLCKLADPQRGIAEILRRLYTLRPDERREGIVQLLILSGLRGLKAVVQTEVQRMPISIDIHENEFLEEIFQEGRQEGGRDAARRLLLSLLNEKFGSAPQDFDTLTAGADLAQIERWTRRILRASTIDQVFES